MAKIKNMGTATMKFGEGIIVTGSSPQLYVSGNITLESAAEPFVQFKEGQDDRAKISINDSDNLVIHQQTLNKHIVFKVNDQGQTREGLRLDGAIPEVVVNQASDSLIDFRVESDNNTHMLYVDGGNDRVGIGTDSPSTQLHVSNNSTDDLLFLETTEDSSSASPIIKLKRNSSSPADADYLGQFKFQGENNADQNVTYAKITGKIGSVVDGQEQGIIEFANIKDGSSTITARFKHDSLQLLNGTSLSVDGDAEISQYLYHKGDTNTYIQFTNDRIRLNAGGINFVDLEKDSSTPYPLTINNGGNRINFRVVDRNSDLLLKTNSEDHWAGLYYAGSQKLVTSNTGVSVTGDVNDVLAVGSVNASDTGADTNFFVSGSTRSRGSSTAGTSVFGGDLVVSGTLTAVQKHICTAKYTMDSANREYIRFNAAGSNGTPSVNNKFVTPSAGNLSYIMIRSTGTPGQTSIGFHRASDGTTDLGTTPIDTQNIVMSSADTTYQVYFTPAANFGPGDIVGLSVDPAANHGNVDITLVFELDFVL